MRRFCLAGVSLIALAAMAPASAADLPTIAPTAVPLWSWTGLYFGSHIGEAWARKNWQSADGFFSPAGPFGTDFLPFAAAGTAGGVFGGLQAGYNVQYGPVVWGLEIEGSTADLDGNARCAVAFYLCNSRIDYMGTLTGRVGYAFGHALLYVRGGGAYAHDTYLMTAFEFPQVFNANDSRFGWTAGIGVEYAFTPAWSTKLEFDYLDFGSGSTTFIAQAPAFYQSNIAIDQTVYRMKAGINYKFDWSMLGFAPPANAPAVVAAAFSPDSALAPAVPAWTIEAGVRYWYSNGRYQKNLFDTDVAGRLNSRLSYDDMPGHAGEAFGRFDHHNGLFIKANLGVGDLIDGTLHDEDFPAFVYYSNTVSNMKDGRMRYGSADAGYNFLTNPLGKLGAYIGYRYFYERGNGFGCRQTATDLVCVPTISANYLGLSETETWRGVAVGLNTQMQLADRVRLEMDGAILPYVNRYGFDNHWFRPDINPQLELAHGWGAQFEAILSYAVTPQWSVGLGGRYWYFTTTEGSVQFPGSVPDSPMKFSAERYGGFLQTSYKLGGGFGSAPGMSAPAGIFKAPPLITPVWDWTGLYGGAHVGGAWGRKEWSPTSGYFTHPDFTPFVGWGDVDGFVGGGQVGANYQIANWVLGLEGEFSWSDLDGYAPCAGFFTCHTRTDNVATAAGRLGYAYGNLLIYSKAGTAWAWDRHDVVAAFETGNVFTADVTRAGWMVGSGLEYGFTPNWSAKIEYNYLDFGTNSVAFTDQVGNSSTIDMKQTIQTVKVGTNYRFNWAAPAAAYAAPAAGLVVQAPLPEAPFTWRGIYMGLHTGAAHYDTDWSNPFGPQVFGDTIGAGGWLAGGQLGFNYQTGALVLGLEADASAAYLDGSNTCLVGLDPRVGGVNCTAKVNALGTAAARIGYAFDRTLLYIKGGGAWADNTFELNLVGVGASNYAVSSGRWGWTVGGGIEYALLPNVTAKLEYNYLALGSHSVAFNVPPAFSVINNLSIGQDIHAAKLGVNYLFNWGAPVVAKY
jgi:opacity protein-like surface antigen